jgi:HrpA-like RNA helicase
MDRLDLQRISNASATQRAGRAGRTAPGRCVRLWPANEKLEPFDLPEIRRVDLAGTVLSLHAWGKPQVRTFGWYEAPDDETIAAAEELLVMLGALSSFSGRPEGALGRNPKSETRNPKKMAGIRSLRLAKNSRGFQRIRGWRDCSFLPRSKACCTRAHRWRH